MAVMIITAAKEEVRLSDMSSDMSAEHKYTTFTQETDIHTVSYVTYNKSNHNTDAHKNVHGHLSRLI